jgi:hypothetical protein
MGRHPFDGCRPLFFVVLNIEHRTRKYRMMKCWIGIIRTNLMKSSLSPVYPVFHHSIFLVRCSIFKNTEGGIQLVIRKPLQNSHATMPIETAILSECFVPNCGISTTASASFMAISETPSTSLPKMRATFRSLSD